VAVAVSKAKTAEEYLDELPEERREVVAAVRKLIRKNLPKGFEESVNWGMLSYEVPLKVLPDTYNGQPATYVALAAQKNYYALYLMGAYSDPEKEKELRDAFRKAGKKLDMGKSCVRFKKLDDLPLEAIGKIIGKTTLKEYVATYEAGRAKRKA
jgi:hypothetical protein